MGSTCTHRRDLLERVAHLIAEAHHHGGDDPDLTAHVAAYLELEGDEVVFGVRGFDEHPSEVDWHVDVRESWWGFVLCTRGRAHFLDHPDAGPEPIVSTFARSREGDEVSLLRRGDDITELPGRAEGRIPDLVRALLP